MDGLYGCLKHTWLAEIPCPACIGSKPIPIKMTLVDVLHRVQTINSRLIGLEQAIVNATRNADRQLLTQDVASTRLALSVVIKQLVDAIDSQE